MQSHYSQLENFKSKFGKNNLINKENKDGQLSEPSVYEDLNYSNKYEDTNDNENHEDKGKYNLNLNLNSKRFKSKHSPNKNKNLLKISE